MYERFTDRARKVMQLANQEAVALCHEYIGTEHILIGLCKEGSGVAAAALASCEVGLDRVREAVLRIVQRGPDSVTRDKVPMTPRSKKVIEYAMEESRDLGHHYVGTEHLLLGLLRETEGVAAQVLTQLGVTLDKVHTAVLDLIGSRANEQGRLTAVAEPCAGQTSQSRPMFDANLNATSPTRVLIDICQNGFVVQVEENRRQRIQVRSAAEALIPPAEKYVFVQVDECFDFIRKRVIG